jgi:hypothetical protein
MLGSYIANIIHNGIYQAINEMNCDWPTLAKAGLGTWCAPSSNSKPIGTAEERDEHWDWLRSLGLERHEQAFIENDSEAEILPSLTPKT